MCKTFLTFKQIKLKWRKCLQLIHAKCNVVIQNKREIQAFIAPPVCKFWMHVQPNVSTQIANLKLVHKCFNVAILALVCRWKNGSCGDDSRDTKWFFDKKNILNKVNLFFFLQFLFCLFYLFQDDPVLILWTIKKNLKNYETYYYR